MDDSWPLKLFYDPSFHYSQSNPITLVTLKSLLADRALTVKRPRAQPPSLIFSLPAEMLAEVFMQVTAEDQSPEDLRAPMRGHFMLAQVCGLWRAVALHTPALWCCVILHLGTRKSGFGGITRLARACFERSCELPLALVITTSVENASNIPNLCMDLVLPVRHRVRHLELRLPAVFTESLFKLPRNSLKALKSITVYAATVSSMESGVWFRSMSALEGAPLLDRVKLGCTHPLLQSVGDTMARQMVAVRLDPYVAGLPWTQLTELDLDYLELRSDDALYALEMCTALERCTIEVRVMPPLQPTIAFTLFPPQPTDPPPPPPKPKPPVTVPALRVLALMLAGHDSAPTDFFDRLILPALTDLSIAYRGDARPLPCETLLELQKRSAPMSLERLRVVNRKGDSLLPFLESNPQLVDVQLVLCAQRLAPVARALTCKADGEEPVLLPALRSLVLLDQWAEESSPTAWTGATKALLEMARSRWKLRDGVQRLKELQFGSFIAVSAKRAERFEVLREKGMDLRIMNSEARLRTGTSMGWAMPDHRW
ncbi:hypothetical protein FB45DRAFT_1056964 [Roridomyces roridus]|uniref:F-box domain-containing protein n=1 Tax=Roridomyces roridus TaxID=1738132 RepID=A0AAD7FSH6_9AGAR|nr:hypothetical protein FB45DRAFT_1056964 [Roridomyces roridus]